MHLPPGTQDASIFPSKGSVCGLYTVSKPMPFGIGCNSSFLGALGSVWSSNLGSSWRARWRTRPPKIVFFLALAAPECFFCFQIVSGVAFGRYLDLFFGVLYRFFTLLLPFPPSTVCGVSDTNQRVLCARPFSLKLRLLKEAHRTGRIVKIRDGHPIPCSLCHLRRIPLLFLPRAASGEGRVYEV